MELPKGSLVNGYVIKRKICASELYSIYEAVDKSGRTFIIKAIPETAQDLSYLSSPESQSLGSFYCDGHYFLLYPAQDYRSEGSCYFSYKPERVEHADRDGRVTDGSEVSADGVAQPKSILSGHCSPGGISIHSDTAQGQLSFGELPKRKLTCSSDGSGESLKKCPGRVRTPAPKVLRLARPNTPESFNSAVSNIYSDSDEDSESNSDIPCSSESESAYSDFESEEEDEDDEERDDDDNDNQESIISELEAGAGSSCVFFTASRDTPVLKSCLVSGIPSGVPSHIQIDCPVSRFLEVKHRTIRRTPAPLGVTSPTEGCATDFSKNRSQFSCNFPLKIMRGSVLRRRKIAASLPASSLDIS